MQDVALDANGRWIKCVLNVKFIVFHMTFRKYLNFRTSENFWNSKFISVFLGKIVGKNSEQPFLAILNLYQSFWEKLSEKFRMVICGHSKFVPVFLGKIVGKIWNSHFWQF